MTTVEPMNVVDVKKQLDSMSLRIDTLVNDKKVFEKNIGNQLNKLSNEFNAKLRVVVQKMSKFDDKLNKIMQKLEL